MVKNINQASLQMLCPLVKKINPLHNEQKKINSFLNGQDASKVLVDLQESVFHMVGRNLIIKEVSGELALHYRNKSSEMFLGTYGIFQRYQGGLGWT